VSAVRKFGVLGAAAVLVALSLASCGDGGGDRLAVYSGRSRNLVLPLLTQFSEETGIKIDVRYGDSADLALLIAEEGDDTPADVFLSQSPGAIEFLDGEDRLRAVDPALLDAVDDDFHAADGTWVGLTGRVRTLVYNTDLVDEAELPHHVVDLTQPAYRGKLAVAPGNASFQDFVTALRHTLGEADAAAWLEGIAANDPQEYANNTAIVEAVSRGEIEMGLVNHYYIARATVEDPTVPIAMHFYDADDPGRLLLVSAAGVLDSTDRSVEAERLIEFLLQPDAQRFFADETFEYPLAAGVQPVASVTPLAAVAPTVVDLQGLGGDLRTTIELIGTSGLGE
jgi:iron(III) transport system substrate-binding protein